MGSATHPRGRLPRRVYWVRRGLVVFLAVALVLGIGKLLGGNGTDASSRAVRASTASAQSTESSPTVPVGPVAPPRNLVRNNSAAPVLAAPTGDCLDDEVTVLPTVPKAAAGGDIAIRLQLLGTQPACTFKVAPETLAVKITSGAERIWSSQDCPKAIPATTVVVRSGTPVEVPVVWSGRRSDEECSTRTSWAMPGFYHVFAAALGSTPTDVQFEVTLPNRRVVTRTAQPKPQPTPAVTATPATPAAKPTATPSKRP